MEKAILSKSTFIKGEQCLKALYLYKNRYFLRDKMPAERVATFTRGTNVGLLAQDIFPNGIDCKAGGPRQYEKAIAKTQMAINSGEKVLYEAAFLHTNTLIYLDVLVLKDDGWHAYEVKSSLKLSETYFKDAALQYYIITASGLKLKSFNLVYLNESYQRNNFLDLNELFSIQDVTEIIKKEKEEIKEKILHQLEIIAQDHSPQIEIGLHCKSPYDCDFVGHCWNKTIENKIFTIPTLSFEQKFALFKTYENIDKFDHELLEFDMTTNRIIESKIQDISLIDKELMKNIFPQNQEYSILKILSFHPAVPMYPNTKPYELILFGYQITKYNSQGIEINKNQIIYGECDNPTNSIVESVTKYLEQNNNIFTFEENENIINHFNNQYIINLYTFFAEGNIIFPSISDFNFINIYKSIFGKSPWYKKLSIDKQSGLNYEKLIKSQFTDLESKELIKDYLEDSAKYFNALLLKISTY